jgi:molecular chaperone HtpG
MKEGQDKIYYVTADSWQAASASPHLEVFRKKGIEVLLLTDRVDEWMLSFLNEFDGKALVSVARGDLDLGQMEDEAAKAEHEKTAEQFKPLVEKAAEVLKDKAKEVRITFRLTESPSCVVSDEGDMSGYLQRMLKQAGQSAPAAKPILELNPEHALVQKVAALVDESDTEAFADRVHVLFDQALLAEGGSLEDPAAYVRRVNRLLG